MKRLLNRLGRLDGDHRRIALGAARVAFFLIIGKLAGAFKEMAVAYRYGISDVVDAYQFTMTFATWVPVTLVGVLSVVLIPVLVRLRKDEHRQNVRFLGELQTLAWWLGLALAALIILAWPWVLQGPGAALNAETMAYARELAWGFAPVALFTVLAGVSAARLRARERHVNTLLDSVPALVILVWVMLAGPDAGIAPLLWGTVLGFAVQCIWLQWLAARADNGIWGAPTWGLGSPYWHGMAQALGIMMIGQLVMSLVGPLDQYTAARLSGNANATLGYAARLLSLLLGIGAMSVGRAALPVLSEVQSRGEPARARQMALKWSMAMAAIGVVAVAVGWWLAPWGVALIFERGAFGPDDTRAVAQVLRWGMLQLPFYFGVLVLVQLLASQKRYRIMAAIAVMNFAVKALMNHLLAPAMGVAGIMLATSLMYLSSYLCYFLVASRPYRAHDQTA
ncbi:MAG: lipid II flippase MurJ [Corticimicrobacter sp.]|uniref:murein biosynthesis integral membrane protein MurJ n=1 Tax=Corticimicrobacter sp. TaxID=2678536 RepID=UPI0032DAE29A